MTDRSDKPHRFSGDSTDSFTGGMDNTEGWTVMTNANDHATDDATESVAHVSATESVADEYVWTARKDGTGKPVAYSGPHTLSDATAKLLAYPRDALRDVVIFCAPGGMEDHVWRALVAYNASTNA